MNDAVLFSILLGGAALGVVQATTLFVRLALSRPLGASPELDARTRRARIWLATIPLWIIPLHVGLAAVLFSERGWFWLGTLEYGGMLNALLFAWALLANAVLPTRSYLGFVVGMLVVSQGLYVWTQVEIARSDDALASIGLFTGPLGALLFAPYGSAFGWLIGSCFKTRDA